MSAALARRLLRGCGRAALATSLQGAPCASLVLIAADFDASPLLLLSDLALHSRNIAFDPRISLLLDATAGHPDPLAGPRLSVLGRAETSTDPVLMSRFAARHPASRVYAGFVDFHLYRVAVERGHLVAGFGRIEWIAGADLSFPGEVQGFAAGEAAMLDRLNREHREMLDRCARRQGGGIGWNAAGLDPEGLDLRRGDDALRLDFAAPAASPEAVPAALAELARWAAE